MTAPVPAAESRTPNLVRAARARVVRTWAWVPFAALVVAQIAIPLTDHDPTIEWLSSLVVVAFAATTFVLASRHWGLSPATVALAVVVALTVVVERLGTSTGFPFGDYEYTGALQPAVAGVPVIVPLAWFAMGIAALEVGHAISARRPVAVVSGAVALTAWDLFLDPQMVDAGYWEWTSDGWYHGIPLTNYAGWLGTGIVVLAAVEPLREPGLRPSVGLLGLYTWWTVMSTIGFVVFFGEPLIGLAGGAAMGTMITLAWRRRARRPGAS